MTLFPISGGDQTDLQFEQMIRPLISHLYRLAYRFCGDQDNAEDLVQDVLTKLYTQREEMLQVESLKPWVSKVLYHLFVDQARKNRRSPISLVADDSVIEDMPMPFSHQPDQNLERDQEIQHVEQAYLQLTDEHRAVIALHDIEGYPLNEIVVILDIPLGTLKSRLHRARARLKELLEYQYDANKSG